MADVAFADSTKSIHDSLGNATHSVPGELQPKSVLSRLHSLASTHPMMQLCMLAFLVMTSVCFMYPGAGNALRTPPAWGPEMESTYSFRQWSRDILLWSIASDLEPARKAAAVMLTLRGAARELSRQIPPQAVVAGGLINGAQVDPLTYLMHALQERFGNLGEEVRVQAITELMTFNRKGNEPVDSLLVRFDSIRARAAEQGGAVVGVQGVAWILLRAIGISDQQLIQLLAPFNGLFPANEAELTQLKTSLRRMGHILERTPGNLREGLRISGPNPSHAFMTQEESWREHPSNDQWNQYEHSTSHEWSGQAAFNASSSSYPSNVDTYATFEDDDIDTDSNTSSGECSSVDAEGQDPNRVAQSLFWAYKQAKHKWRKFMGKSTRAVRRYAKRFNKFRGKGKGKKGHSTFTVGKGKGKKGKHPVTAMLAEMDDAEVQMALPAFRGQRTPGKGKGRRSNPKGPDGQLMRCFECGSTEHLDLVPGSQSSLPRSSTYPKGRVELSFGEPQVEPCHITSKVSGTRGTCEAHEHDQSQPIHMNTHVRTTDSFLTLSDRKAQIPVQAVLQTLTCLALGSVTLLGLVCMADVAFADSTKSIHDSLGNATHSVPGELQPKSVLSRLHSLASTHPMMQLCMLAFLVMTSVCFMYPGAGNALRTPPAWGPEMESTYSFRQWSRDILLWSIASDLEPARKAAAVMLTLRGAARELSRQIPPQAVVAGGLINGAQVDPLTYLMHALQERFGNLGEEVRVQAITELMTFNRKGNEPVDSLLVRFDSIRARAAEQGGAVVGVQGVAWILLRAIGISDQQLIQLLAPFNGLFPANEAELTQLKTSLRRMGHILERTPGNLREGLRISGPNPSHAFMTQEESWREHPSNDQWNQYEHSTSHEWSGQAAFNASSSSYPSNVDTYATFEDDDIDTDSNTSSGECSSVDAEGQDPNRVAQSLFWAYKQAKHKWRKFMGKSTRAVRRYAKRFNKFRGKGKGKKGHSTFTVGKGKGKKGKHPVTAMLAEMDDAEVQMALPAFRGQRTPGKGKGRRSNPKGPDGQLMRCFECGSTEHLAGSCPRRAHSGSNPATAFFARPSHTGMTFAGPLAGLIDDSDLQPIYHVSTASQVTFATHAEDTESGSQTYHAYMFSSDETDPLQQHDPWGSQTSQSWSVPTSAPQSYGPAGRANPSPPQSSWFPFGMFGRQQPSNPASRSWEPEHVPPENRPSPSHNASEHEPIAPGSPAVPSHEPVGHSMNWASIAQMPSELRNLLPFPVLAPPTVPAFAERPEFGFLEYRAQPQMPSPPTLREPQLSQLEGPAQMQIEDFHFVQQHVAYQRQHYRDMPGNRPALQVRSQLDHQHRPQMAEFHQTQRDIDRLRRHRKDRIRNVNTAEAEYDGAADTCPLCCEKMEANESVLRLVCKHLYHVECWTSYLCHGEQLTCPVCRGSCHVIARFRVPADTDGPQRPQEASRPVTPDQTGRRDRELPDTFNIFTPPGRAPRINSESPEVGTPFLQQEQASNAYPWWPSESAALTTAYHSISIPDRAGIIIDPGAYTNLIGENTARMFAQKAIENGFKPRQWKMKPMYVQGVGEGQQKCEWTVSIPIACNLSVGGTKVCLNYFEAPVVGGSGARLPALLGLKSLTSLSATLCMHANQEALYVPLPGGSIEDLQQCRK